MRKKRFISLLIVWVMIFTGLNVNTDAYADGNAGSVIESGTCDNGVVWSVSDDNGSFVLEISQGAGATAVPDYSVPSGPAAAPWVRHLEKINTVKVNEGITEIGNRFCYGAINLTSISLPKTVTVTGNGAFRGCVSMGAISLSAPVTDMDDNLFYGCTSLETAVIAEGTTVIGRNMFSGCTSLKSISLPATVTDIGETAFKNTALETVVYTGSIEQYKAMLKKNKLHVAELLNPLITVTCSDGGYSYRDGDLPEDDEKIKSGQTGEVGWRLDLTTKTLTISGTGAMANYTKTNATDAPWYDYFSSIEKLVIEPGVTNVGARIMYGAPALVSVSIPDTVTTIGNGAFRSCSALREAVIPGSVTTIVDNMFYSCPLLERVVIHEGVPMLGRNMFYKCSSLRRLELPSTIATVNQNALQGAVNISDITYGGTKQQYKELITDNQYMNLLQNSGIKVNCSDGVYYWGNNGQCGGTVNYMLNETTGVLTISGAGAAYDYADAASVPWSDDAASVLKVIIKPGITYIGKNLFAGCTNIAAVEFYGREDEWNALKSTCGENNETLFNARVAFCLQGDCSYGADDSVTWQLSEDESTLTISGRGRMINYPGSRQAPWYNSLEKLTKVVVGPGVTLIGDYSFYGLKNLVEVELAGTVEELGTYSFGECASLAAVTLPEGLRIIGAKAFNGCIALAEITLPKTLTNIDMKAFLNNVSLRDVYYNGSSILWSKVMVSESASGNANLLSASIHCLGDSPDYEALFVDVRPGDASYDSLCYIYDCGYLKADGVTGMQPERQAVLQDAADMLYMIAGSPGDYKNAEDFVTANNIIEGKLQDGMTAEELITILYRASLYNGYAKVPGDTELESALSFAGQNAIPAALPGAEGLLDRSGYFIIMEAYLRSGKADADRYDNMIAVIREVIAKNGDGNMYIVVPSLKVSGITGKSGDSTFILFPDGQTMLLDFGLADCEALELKFIRDLGLSTVNYFAVSHPHSDHIGNAMAVANYIYSIGGSIENYWYSGFNYGSAVAGIESYLSSQGVNIDNNVVEGRTFRIGPVVVEIFGPDEEAMSTADTGDEAINNTSVLMKFTYGKSTFLTGGDLYASMEARLLARYGDRLRADIAKSNHHGLYTSNTDEWLMTVAPQVMFSETDDVGQASKVKTAGGIGTAYYSNGIDGLVLISIDDNSCYSAVTQYDSALRKDLVREFDDDPDIPDNPPVSDNPPAVVNPGQTPEAEPGPGDDNPVEIEFESGEKKVLTADDIKKAIEEGGRIVATVNDSDGSFFYSWTFSPIGEEEAGISGPLNLELEVQAADNKNLPGSAGSEISGHGLAVLSFKHSGALPSEASVRISLKGLENIKPGMVVYLYYVDGETGGYLELPKCSYVVGSDYCVNVKLSHCSEYVLTDKRLDEAVRLSGQISLAENKKTLYAGGTSDYECRALLNIPGHIRPVEEFSKAGTGAYEEVIVSYRSSDESVAVVDGRGIITAKGPGSAKIKVTVKFSAGYEITLTESVRVRKAAIKLTPSSTTVKKGESVTYKLTLQGYDADSLVWRTKYKKIAVVGKNRGSRTASVRGKTAGTDILLIYSGGRVIYKDEITVE